MKFAAIFALVATASAVVISGNPTDSAKARESTLDTSRKVVASQNSFEAAHTSTHLAAMAKQAADTQAQKDAVRLARSRQVAGGDQTPPMKKY